MSDDRNPAAPVNFNRLHAFLAGFRSQVKDRLSGGRRPCGPETSQPSQLEDRPPSSAGAARP